MSSEASETMMTTISAAHDTGIPHTSTSNTNLGRKLRDALQLVRQPIYRALAAPDVDVTDTLITLGENYDEKARDEGIFLLSIPQPVT